MNGLRREALNYLNDGFEEIILVTNQDNRYDIGIANNYIGGSECQSKEL